MASDLLKGGVIFACILAVLVVGFRYFRERDRIFWDSSTYFILLSCLYVGVPAWVQLDTSKSYVGASYETILFSSQYSFYFLMVLIGYYAYKAFMPARGCFAVKPLSYALISDGVVYVLYGIAVVYVLLVFFTHYPGVNELWSNRSLASAFASNINDTYKITFVFYSVVSMVVYLAIKNGRAWFVVMLLPFVMMDILTTDRGFLFRSLMVWIAILLLNGRRVPVAKLLVLSFFIIVIEVLRVEWQRSFEWGDFLFVPAELKLTAEAGLLILESDRAVSVMQYVGYSLGKVFTPQLWAGLFGDIHHFREIIVEESPLSFGLGGSLLSEVYSFKNNIVLMVYPFLVIAYLEVVNYLRRWAGVFGVMVFVFYLASTITIFRSGVIFSSMEPVYYTIYAFSWYWVVSFIARERKLFFLSSLKRESVKFICAVRFV